MIDNLFYNVFISKLTLSGYGIFFDKVAPGSRILDIGIGNGLMLRKYHARIRELGLRIDGIDLNESYLGQCRRLVRRYDLADLISVERRDFMTEDIAPASYDYVFFSLSLPLIERKAEAMQRAKALLRGEGRIVIFHTVQFDESRLMELIKPRLKYVSTIDFGKVTYHEDFEAMLVEQSLIETDRARALSVSGKSEAQVLFVKPSAA